MPAQSDSLGRRIRAHFVACCGRSGAAIVAEGCAVSVWVEGRTTVRLEGHRDWVHAADILSNGTIATTSADGTLRAWGPDGDLRWTVELGSPALCMTVTSEHIAVGTWAGEVWAVELDGSNPRSWQAHPDDLVIQIASCRNTFVSGGGDGRLVVDGGSAIELGGAVDALTSFEDRVIAGTAAGELVVFDLGRNRELVERARVDIDDPVTALVASKAGIFVATVTGDVAAYELKPTSLVHRWTRALPGTDDITLDLEPDAEHLMAGHGPTVTLLHTATGVPARVLKTQSRTALQHVTVSPANGSVVGVGADVVRWPLEPIEHAWAHAGLIREIARDHRRNRLITSGNDGTVGIWSLENGGCEALFQAHRSIVWSAASLDQTSWVTGTDDEVCVWRSEGDGAPLAIRCVQRIAAPGHAVVPHPDGRHLVVGGGALHLGLIDLQTAAVLVLHGELSGAPSTVLRTAWIHVLPDGRVIFRSLGGHFLAFADLSSGSLDYADCAGGQIVQQFVSPAGHRLVTVDHLGRTAYWSIDPWDEIDAFECPRSSAAISPSWDQMVIAGGGWLRWFELTDDGLRLVGEIAETRPVAYLQLWDDGRAVGAVDKGRSLVVWSKDGTVTDVTAARPVGTGLGAVTAIPPNAVAYASHGMVHILVAEERS